MKPDDYKTVKLVAVVLQTVKFNSEKDASIVKTPPYKGT